MCLSFGLVLLCFPRGVAAWPCGNRGTTHFGRVLSHQQVHKELQHGPPELGALVVPNEEQQFLVDGFAAPGDRDSGQEVAEGRQAVQEDLGVAAVEDQGHQFGQGELFLWPWRSRRQEENW